VTVAPQRIPFTKRIGEELLAHMTDKNKTVALEGVGSPSDWKIAEEVKEFLEKNGYTVNISLTGMSMPQPESPFSFYENPTEYHVIVAPSAH
jgi:hypothetical protein